MEKREKMLLTSDQYCEFIWGQQSICFPMAGLSSAARALLPTFLMPGSQRASLTSAAAGRKEALAIAVLLLGQGKITLRKQEGQLPHLLPPLQIDKPRCPPIPGSSTTSLPLFLMQKHPSFHCAPAPHPPSSYI